MEEKQTFPADWLLIYGSVINKMGQEYVSADFDAEMHDDLSFNCTIHGEQITDYEQVINYMARRIMQEMWDVSDKDLDMLRSYCFVKGVKNGRYNNPFEEILNEKYNNGIDQRRLTNVARYLLLDALDVEEDYQTSIDGITVEDVDTGKTIYFDLAEIKDLNMQAENFNTKQLVRFIACNLPLSFVEDPDYGYARMTDWIDDLFRFSEMEESDPHLPESLVSMIAMAINDKDEGLCAKIWSMLNVGLKVKAKLDEDKKPLPVSYAMFSEKQI